MSDLFSQKIAASHTPDADTMSGLFALLADAMPQMIFVADADGAHFYFNRGWYDYTGMSASESMGFGFADALHPGDRERTVARWRLAWEAGADYQIEYRFKRFDGVYRWFVGRAMPVRDANGAVHMWVGTCTDIDDTRRAFDSLSESQGRLTVALQAAHLGTWRYDLATQGMTVSDETRAVFGVAPSDVFGISDFSERIHADYRASVLADFGRVVSRETDDFVARYPVVRDDGTTRYVHLLGRYYPGTENGAGHITGVIQDMTESQTALDTLQRSLNAQTESQERLSLALDTARLGTWELDHATQAFDFSPRTQELFGVTHSPVFEEWASLIHPDDRAAVAAATAFVRGDAPYTEPDAVISLRYRVCRADNTVRYLLIKGSRIVDANGMLTRSLGVAQDETEERGMLDALRASEARFRSVVGNAPIVVFATDKNGMFTFSDGAGLASLGLQPGEVVGNSVLDMYRDRPDICDGLRRALGGEIVSWMATVNGTTFDTRCTPVLSEAGEPNGIIAVAFDVSEKEMASNALIAREAQYRFLFDTVASGVVYQDGDGRIMDANVAAEEILGLTVGQMTGRDTFDPRWRAVHEDGSDFPGDQHPVAVALRTGQAVRGVTMGIFHPAEERYRWISVSAVPMTRPGETVPYQVYAYFEDHTEQREADRLLREEEARFRALADHISQLAWMTDPTGYIHWYNKRWFDYTGTTLETVRGLGWQKVHHPDTVDAVTAKFAAHIERGEEWEDTFPIRGVDGQYRWFLSRAVPLKDDGGKIVRWFGTNTDITAARDAEAEIRQSEARFRSLITATAQIVWTTDANGAFAAVQPAWESFTGQPFGEYQQSGWIKAVHEDDCEATVAQWEAALAAQTPFEIEHRLRRADGVFRYMLVRAVPVRAADDSVREWVGVHSDISERKTVEIALSEYATKQARVAETLQRSLLNAPPGDAFAGVTLATHYEPALDEAQVGGDFFDVFALRGGKVAFVVGDVTGKGLKAAEHTGQIKYALRAFLRENADPADAVARVNRLLTDAQFLDVNFDADDMNAMAAATVAVLEPSTGRLQVTGSGSEFPLWYHGAGACCTEIMTQGVVVGAYGDSVYTTTEVVMEPGDLLILCTDGITEARRSRHDFFGNEGVRAAAESAYAVSGDPEDMCAAIVQAAKGYSATGQFSDDVCLLVARRT